MNNYEILLVDDDRLILKTLGDALESKGYKITAVENGEDAIKILEDKYFDLIIVDLVMKEIDGIGVLKKAKEINEGIIVVILTGYGDMDSAIKALRFRADDFLLKPCKREEIYFRISNLLEKAEYKKKIKIYENILPVCCGCKKIRDDKRIDTESGIWMPMEDYMYKKAGIATSHTYCPECKTEFLKNNDLL